MRVVGGVQAEKVKKSLLEVLGSKTFKGIISDLDDAVDEQRGLRILSTDGISAIFKILALVIAHPKAISALYDAYKGGFFQSPEGMAMLIDAEVMASFGEGITHFNTGMEYFIGVKGEVVTSLVKQLSEAVVSDDVKKEVDDIVRMAMPQAQPDQEPPEMNVMVLVEKAMALYAKPALEGFRSQLSQALKETDVQAMLNAQIGKVLYPEGEQAKEEAAAAKGEAALEAEVAGVAAPRSPQQEFSEAVQRLVSEGRVLPEIVKCGEDLHKIVACIAEGKELFPMAEAAVQMINNGEDLKTAVQDNARVLSDVIVGLTKANFSEITKELNLDPNILNVLEPALKDTESSLVLVQGLASGNQASLLSGAKSLLFHGTQADNVRGFLSETSVLKMVADVAARAVVPNLEGGGLSVLAAALLSEKELTAVEIMPESVLQRLVEPKLSDFVAQAVLPVLLGNLSEHKEVVGNLLEAVSSDFRAKTEWVERVWQDKDFKAYLEANNFDSVVKAQADVAAVEALAQKWAENFAAAKEELSEKLQENKEMEKKFSQIDPAPKSDLIGLVLPHVLQYLKDNKELKELVQQHQVVTKAVDASIKKAMGEGKLCDIATKTTHAAIKNVDVVLNNPDIVKGMYQAYAEPSIKGFAGVAAQMTGRTMYNVGEAVIHDPVGSAKAVVGVAGSAAYGVGSAAASAITGIARHIPGFGGLQQDTKPLFEQGVEISKQTVTEVMAEQVASKVVGKSVQPSDKDMIRAHLEQSGAITDKLVAMVKQDQGVVSEVVGEYNKKGGLAEVYYQGGTKHTTFGMLSGGVTLKPALLNDNLSAKVVECVGESVDEIERKKLLSLTVARGGGGRSM